MATMGAEIIALRNSLNQMTEETNGLSRTMTDTVQILSDMSNTINAQSDMGRGLANLANQSSELSRQAIQDLSTIINFMEERISAAERGSTESAAAIGNIGNDISNISGSWFA